MDNMGLSPRFGSGGGKKDGGGHGAITNGASTLFSDDGSLRPQSEIDANLGFGLTTDTATIGGVDKTAHGGAHGDPHKKENIFKKAWDKTVSGVKKMVSGIKEKSQEAKADAAFSDLLMGNSPAAEASSH